MTAPRKAPADRQPRLKAGEYAFTHEGRTYKLPPASAAVGKISGQVFRDAVMGGDETKLSLTMLEACGAPKATLDVLYSKSAPDMLGIVAAWMNAGDGVGASLGESSSSST